MKRLPLLAGLACLALIWGGPLLGQWRDSFTAHMVAHMGVVAIAAPLLALGLAGTRWDISGRSALFSPLPASILDLCVVAAWHAPAMRAAATAFPLVTAAEQASFLAAGLVLWLACLGQGGTGRHERSAAGALGLLFTSIHMTLLGALLTLSPRPLYGAGEVTCFGISLSAQADQQFGGVAMLLIGAAAYMAGGLALLARVLSAPHKEAAR